jgi:hypothetical protein
MKAFAEKENVREENPNHNFRMNLSEPIDYLL